jgi:membrane protease YdiL (CAAX protease family)
MTAHTANALAPAQRLGRLEDPGSDFPFYNGIPVGFTGWQWCALVLGVVAGFAALVWPVAWPSVPLGAMVQALLLVAIPLAVLARLAPGHRRVLFGRVGWRELRLMLGFAVLNIVVSVAVGSWVQTFTEVTPNAAAAQLAAMDTLKRLAFFAKTLPQLLGEEVLTVLPFLAMLTWLTQRAGVGRRRAVLVAWLVSALLFGLMHLPTYGWNWVQCIVVIGTARLVLTLPWILTKNLWVSTGAHIVNDWMLFGMALAGAGLAAQT